MQKDTVLRGFKQYRLQCLGEQKAPADCDSRIILNRDGSPYIVYANLYFKSGHLKKVLKYWDQGFENNTLSEFVDTLHSLLSSYTDGLPKAFVISTAEQQDPGVVQKAIFFSLGSKTINISFIKGARVGGQKLPPSVSLHEALE
jgi:hypothetical protein